MALPLRHGGRNNGMVVWRGSTVHQCKSRVGGGGGGGWECGYFDRAMRPRFDPQKPGINSEAATKLCSLREVNAVGEGTKFSFIFNPHNPRL